MSEDKKYIVRGSIINSMGLIANAVSPMIVFFLARFFPQHEFGLFISLQLFVLTASKFFVLGLDKGLHWYIPQNQRYERSDNHGVHSAINATLISSGVGVVLISLFILLGGLKYFGELNALPQGVILLCLANIIPYMILNMGASALEGIRKPEFKIMINRFLVNTSFPLFSFAYYFLDFGIYSLAIGFTTANVIGAIWYWFVIQKYFEQWKIKDKVPKELWSYSLPLMFSDLISSLLLRVDIWMVLVFLGAQQSAIYAIMVVLSNSVKTIRQNFDSLIITVVSKMNRQALKLELKEVFSYTINIVTAIQFLIALAILFIPQEILMIAGKDYSSSPLALSVLLIGNLINGILGANGLILLGIGKSKLALIINTISLSINILCNYLLIPPLGIVGAALSTVIALVVQNLMCFIATYIITKQHFYERHLILNISLILGFSFVVYRYFEEIQELDLKLRLIYLILSVIGASGLFFMKKRHFKLNSSPSE